MLIGLSVLVLIVVAVVVFFVIPYSPLKAEFNRDVKERIDRSSQVTGVLIYEEVEHFPLSVKRYLETCGYMGKPKSSRMKISFKNTDFKLSREKPMIKIGYSQVNFVQKPDRLAFIDTRMYGIPFQGYDSLLDGEGGMKGVLAKGITLFNETGGDMDQACLVTFLSESLLIPDAALQNYISWKEVDNTHAKAIITYGGIEASGLFTFSETGELLSFSTDDRIYTSMNGDRQQVKWTALFCDYQTKDGRKQPSRLQAIWHLPEGDMIYFDGRDFRIDRFM